MEPRSYIHGTEPSEQARLKLLNELTNQPFIDFLEIEAADFVLEIGSGLGILAEEVARLFPKSQVFGLEYSSEQLSLANPSSPNLHFIRGDARALEFADNRFAVVYCRYVLEHLANLLRALKEMHRVLKPGGKVFVQENNILVNVFYPECPRFEALWKQFAVLQERLGGDALIGKKLLPLLTQAGFQDVKLSIQAEIHYSGKASFRPWIENQIGNVDGAAKKLLSQQLATEEEINLAIAELRSWLDRDDACAFFYWNRGSGIKTA